jgi:hypothetical protein
MTTEEVIQGIKAIRNKANEGDHEAAHSSEDALREEVLKAIAQGAENAAELAQIVLLTSELDFERWCA